MKNVMKSVDDFDKAISELDKLSADGWAIYRLAFRKFEKIRDKGPSGANDKALHKALLEYRARHHEWHDKVYKSIGQLTDRNYYWVLFVNAPANDGKWISGLGPHVSDFVIGFENRIRVLNDILTMLDERRGTVIRQEIARKEYDSSYRYWLRYDELSGRLYLNDTILLATTRLDWPPDRLLQQVFANPNAMIELDGVTSAQVSSALRDLHITGPLKKIFFPRTSGNKVMFRPAITNTEFVDEKHQEISIVDLRNNEK
jgi:hypothetical protein